MRRHEPQWHVHGPGHLCLFPARLIKESIRFYQRLIQFRKKHSAIRNGSFTTVLADGRVYGFARENETEIIEIFVNDSDDTVEITVENARSILISKGNFYIVCRKNGEIIEEICS